MTDARLTILAVDDERPQLQDLARILQDSPRVERVDCASDGREALRKASSQAYDAIFLDVRMPDLDGVELARVVRRFAAPPQLVFVTAYDTAAVDAFELHAADYLLKPVAKRRVEEALERVAAGAGAGAAGPPAPDPSRAADGARRAAGSEREVVAVDNVRTGTTRLLPRSSILYLQSHGDFVRVVVEDGRYLMRATLSDMERRWEPHGFARVHRQYLANLNRAVELRPQFGGTAELAFPDGRTIPVARRHVAELGRRLRA
jgi:DNA-binding LytR/AlgR family response regulator